MNIPTIKNFLYEYLSKIRQKSGVPPSKFLLKLSAYEKLCNNAKNIIKFALVIVFCKYFVNSLSRKYKFGHLVANQN